MQQNAYVTLFLSVAFAVVALFAATEVMAFTDYGDPPTDYSLTNQGWTVELVSILECTDPGATAICGARGPGWFDHHYQVYTIDKKGNPTASGLNSLAMLIPDCQDGPEIEVDLNYSIQFNDYFGVAEGDSSIGLGQYNEQTRVAQGESDNTFDWHLVVNTDKVTESTIALKVRSIGVLTYEMAVAGCNVYEPFVADYFSELVRYKTKQGFELLAECVPQSGFCELKEFLNPNGSTRNFKKVTIEQFLSTRKGANKAKKLVGLNKKFQFTIFEDSSPNSPSCCSGGWCWY
jgi:hypothetical protein